MTQWHDTMNGTAGVTLVFTSADGTYPTQSLFDPMMDIQTVATITLTAPTTGSTAGFVIMGDRSMPLGTVGRAARPGTGPSSSSRTGRRPISGVSSIFRTAR